MNDIFIPLALNTLVLFSMSMIYSILPTNYKGHEKINRVLIGLLVCITAMVIMSIPLEFSEGIVFDTRTILISSSGMFFGLIPTIMSSIVMIYIRILQGGAGAFTGVLVILFSGSLGLLWRRFRLHKPNAKINTIELLVMSFLVHIGMFLLMFTLPKGSREDVISGLWFSILFLYPVFGFIVYRFHLFQREHFFASRILQKNENQYRLLFENSKVLLLLIDPVTGYILDANQNALEFYKWPIEVFRKMKIQDINTLTPEEVEIEMELCKQEEKNYFNFKHRTAVGEIFDVEIYSGPVMIDDTEYLLSTILDTTQRKKNEMIIKEQNEKLKYISNHDHLTGLYNRYFFETEIQRLDVERQFPLSVVMGDVNGLKLINDSFSHLEGDKLLKEIAVILKSVVRAEDIVARWGGDEFVILLPQANAEVTERIINDISNLCITSNSSIIRPNISVGYAIKNNKEQNVFDVLKQAEEMMYRKKLSEGASLRNSLISSLEAALIEKSIETKTHTDNMQSWGAELAKEFGLSDDQINTVSLIAKLHDIGKLSIDESILLKPGKLDDTEWEVIKKHPEIGSRIVKSIPDIDHISSGILHHHEWYDGSGYPKGLKGNQIPIESRLISIIDAYEVMINGRIYCSPKPQKEAIEELNNKKGTQFDPELTELFIQILSKRQHS